MLAFASPLSVSTDALPVKFSKFVAPPVVRLRVVPLATVLSSNDKVSTPVPPSSFAKFALLIFVIPLEPVSIKDIVSFPEPISIESPFFNLAELIASLPAFIVNV